ncbi:metallophosphoesterase [Haloferula sp. BvORR071]|uniref:metallophosphoesterase family protein n=1 Tax=Haloferula sp. BvORR071 TaxID=1396141 RepID=UPI0005537305|nr:metallophosphoesterase [Haloferula sp. BvORR071]
MTAPNPSPLKRRNFLGLGAASAAALPMGALAAPAATSSAKLLTVLHITDIHLRPEYDAPARCGKILRAIRQRHRDIGLVINTGDSIYAADYKNITRERVEEQWKLWDEVVMPELKGLPMLHTVGNHDTWWAGPEGDPMRGVPYVCKRLGIAEPYTRTSQGGWEILTLENSSGSLGKGQQDWLFQQLDALPAKAPLLVAGHLPLFSLAGDYDGGNMSGAKAVIDKLAAREAPVVALSGHIHLRSSEELWNIRFHCNGSLSGYWWEPGDRKDCGYKRTPMGYAILKLWPDGRSECSYLPVEKLAFR